MRQGKQKQIGKINSNTQPTQQAWPPALYSIRVRVFRLQFGHSISTGNLTPSAVLGNFRG